jgi:hypothetical protein
MSDSGRSVKVPIKKFKRPAAGIRCRRSVVTDLVAHEKVGIAGHIEPVRGIGIQVDAHYPLRLSISERHAKLWVRPVVFDP